MDREEKIERILFILEKIRPYLIRDGGDVEFIDLTPEGVVEVKLLDACADCGISDMTLKFGIEQAILDEVPGIVSVVAI